MKKGNIAEFKTWRRDFVFPILELARAQEVPKISVSFSTRKDKRPGKKASRVSLLFSRASKNLPYVVESASFSENGFPNKQFESVNGVTEAVASRLADFYHPGRLKEGESPDIRVQISDGDSYPEHSASMRKMPADRFLMDLFNLWLTDERPDERAGLTKIHRAEDLFEARVSSYEALQNYLNFIGRPKLYRDGHIVCEVSARKSKKPGTKLDRAYLVLGKDLSQVKDGSRLGDLPYRVDRFYTPAELLDGSITDVSKRRSQTMRVLHKICGLKSPKLVVRNYRDNGEGLVSLDVMKDEERKNKETGIDYTVKRGIAIEDFRMESSKVLDDSRR